MRGKCSFSLPTIIYQRRMQEKEKRGGGELMDYSWPPFHAAETSLKEHNFNIFSGTGGALWQDWWCFIAGLVVLYSGTGGAL